MNRLVIRLLFALAFIEIFTMGASFADCANTKGLRSIVGVNRATLTIRNQSPWLIKAFWFDYRGQRVFAQNISPGVQWSVQSFVTHAWIITDSNGACLQVFTLTGNLLVNMTAPEQIGQWVPNSDFSQVNIKCLREYECHPVNDPMLPENLQLATSPNISVWGTCAASGAVDTCGICNTTPPTQQCRWHVEPQ